MLDDTNAIRHDSARVRPVLRIAVPVWVPSARKRKAVSATETPPCREEFKEILDAALESHERMHRRMTRRERKQVAATQKLRQALYGSRFIA